MRKIIAIILTTVCVIVPVVAQQSEYDDMTAEPGVTYLYYVRAFNTDGSVSLTGEDPGTRSIVLAPTEVLASQHNTKVARSSGSRA